jgi:hypothetical protein
MDSLFRGNDREGNEIAMFPLTFALCSNFLYYTGQALSLQGRGNIKECFYNCTTQV